MKPRTHPCDRIHPCSAGPPSFALQVLWRIRHGPTVVNEHGVVLAQTNDESSHLERLVLDAPPALEVLAQAVTWTTLGVALLRRT